MSEITLKSEAYVHNLTEAVEFLKLQGCRPVVAIILGSGLGDAAHILSNRVSIPYSKIPHFPVCSAPSHTGNLIFGTLGATEVVVFQGRVHSYEGYSSSEIAFGARVIRCLGVKKFIITNAAGGLNPSFNVGDFMLLRNHVSLFCEDPSRGLSHEVLGPRFYDQTFPYSKTLIDQASVIAAKLDIAIKSGTYCMVPGPRFESAADIEVLRRLGVDAVGMSTVPEVLALRQMGESEILGLSLITNMAAGMGAEALNQHEVLDVGLAARPLFAKVLSGILESM